jgi:hypothetical protein
MINNSSSTSDGEFYEYENIQIRLRRENKKTYSRFWDKKNLFGNIIDDQTNTNKCFTY